MTANKTIHFGQPLWVGGGHFKFNSAAEKFTLVFIGRRRNRIITCIENISRRSMTTGRCNGYSSCSKTRTKQGHIIRLLCSRVVAAKLLMATGLFIRRKRHLAAEITSPLSAAGILGRGAFHRSRMVSIRRGVVMMSRCSSVCVHTMAKVTEGRQLMHLMRVHLWRMHLMQMNLRRMHLWRVHLHL